MGAKPPRLMACLLRLAPACSRVETFVGFGWETPRVFANPLTELTCHKSRRSIGSANRAPVGRWLFSWLQKLPVPLATRNQPSAMPRKKLGNKLGLEARSGEGGLTSAFSGYLCSFIFGLLSFDSRFPCGCYNNQSFITALMNGAFGLHQRRRS